MNKALFFAVAAGLSASYAGAAPTLGPSTWTNNGGGSTNLSQAWVNGANWSTAPDHPSGVGAVAIFNNDPDSDRNVSFTTTGTTNDPVSPAQPQVTIGSWTVNNTSAFTNNFTSGSNSVFLDAAGAGPAVINLLGAATSSGVPTTLNVGFVFSDSVVLTVDKTASGSSVADVNLSGSYSGTGGLTKAGQGTAVVTNGSNVTKTYTGATLVQEGRLRIGTQTGAITAGVARPLQGTSSVTVNSAAQLDLGPSTAVTTVTFGATSATPININGFGLSAGTPIGGTFGLAGAIRTEITRTLTNDIVVQSNAGITARLAATNLTLSGVISGPGQLAINQFGNAADGGTVTMTNDNTYTGGTAVRQGVLVLTGASTDLGTGDVLVDGASNALDTGDASISGLASGRLTISSGVLNAIADTATLSLTGDTATFNGNPDQIPGGFVTLGDGINELVGGLVLGGVTQTEPATYGSSSSPALIKDDRYFAGTGVVTLVPEPAALSLLALGAVGLFGRRRRA